MRIRDGCRGGTEQFRWDSVKDQSYKDREQYLGATTKVGMMGKFGRYYCHDWYTKSRESVESIETERSRVQEFEEELMKEALGLKPKKLLLAKKPLTEEELKEVLSKERSEGRKGRDLMGPQKHLVTNEMGEQVVASDIVEEAARDASIKGLGFASHRTAKLEEYKSKVLGTEGQLEGAKNPGMPSIIKLENDADIIKLGDPGLKQELKSERLDQHIKDEAVDGHASGVKEEPSEVKSELPEEDDLPRSSKRRRIDHHGGRHAEGAREGSEEKRRRKIEKKEKKRKKAEKKMKKQEKKAKKAAKLAARLSKKAKRSSSSASSSST